MKLFRFGEIGREKPGVILTDGRKLDISQYINDYNEEFFAKNGLSEIKNILAKFADKCPSVPDSVRIGSCIARPSKIICIGLNYTKHAEETKAPIPAEPILFFKSTSALVGPNDNLVIPKGSKSTDWEVELAVVIGKKASYVDLDSAMDYIAGYALHNDYSERDFQLHHSGQWVKGKSCDTFAPLGPWLVTQEDIPNPNDLNMWLTVNGKTFQSSNTNDMIFNVPFIVHYISQFMTLLPGDVISTGTPFGVGLGFNPPVYVKAGDVIELGIDKLGQQKQTAINYTKS